MSDSVRRVSLWLSPPHWTSSLRAPQQKRARSSDARPANTETTAWPACLPRSGASIANWDKSALFAREIKCCLYLDLLLIYRCCSAIPSVEARADATAASNTTTTTVLASFYACTVRRFYLLYLLFTPSPCQSCLSESFGHYAENNGKILNTFPSKNSLLCLL